jgi:hypothetical protein
VREVQSASDSEGEDFEAEEIEAEVDDVDAEIDVDEFPVEATGPPQHPKDPAGSFLLIFEGVARISRSLLRSFPRGAQGAEGRSGATPCCKAALYSPR